PVLTPGSIVENTSTNCAGYNPSTISSIQNPSGGTIQWQKAEDCSAANPTWINIVGENTATFNPPSLLVSTCYRRMAFDSCNTVYSNITTFNINPDPSINIVADSDSVCFGKTLNITKTVIGGEGICNIQWQINKVSSSQSSTAWKNTSVSDALAFSFDNPGNDSTFYFRARVDCINSSCNIATSNVLSIVFHPDLSISVPFTDSTICAGANVSISSSGCKGDILWSSGQTSAQINVVPTENTTYTVNCKNSCDAISKSVNITVVPGIEAPNISTSQLNYCFGETIKITATNCVGKVIWSNGIQGASIEITANESFSISASCFDQKCQSPQSQTLNIKVYPVLTPGSIVSNTSTNCAGFNPLTIASVQNPSGGTIQWQKAEDCSAANPTWVNISGENIATFNPPALLVSTCYRRMAFDSCNTVYSNITTFSINPDPSISIVADTDSVCFGNTLNLTKTVIGGEGTCNIQWQINKVSSSQSSTAWKNISVSDALAFSFDNPGNDSTFYFRARVDCSNSSCNIATSNVVSAVFHPQLSISVPFTDSTICAGASVSISSSGCKSQILWSTGETSAQINVAPIENTTYTVTCKNSCDAVSESVNITVVSGIEAPNIATSQLNYCFGEIITLNASNCSGDIIWNNGMKGASIEITANNNFSISAKCQTSECQSPQSQTLNIKVYPVLAPGSIEENTSTNCAGFNPLTIASIQNPSGGTI
ncbi:hypothetical protein EGI22_15605, partial [Lacihabitans sp. LS3-19]|uniref:hypothetical protein n=1 Tax=Lacihabitans sp. LS3-19 TaxID=2487335 RepID=UPI0020CE021A